MKFQKLMAMLEPTPRAGVALVAAAALFVSAGAELKAQSAPAVDEARFAYVGTYTRGAPGGWSAAARDEAPVGVTVWSVGAGMGDLSLVQTVPIDSPSWVTMHPSQDFLYVLNEIQDYGGEKRGSIEAYGIDNETGELSFINRATTGGIPAQIVVNPAGDYLAVATYTGATYEVLPIGDNGSLSEASSIAAQEGSGPHRRQGSPHPHAVAFDQSGRYLATADLGTDWVKVFTYDGGNLQEVSAVQMAPGSGPRHVAFGAGDAALYVINELTATISVHDFDGSTGQLGDAKQLVSTVPANYPSHKSTAEIMVHPSGKFLYASNRKFEDHALADSIVTYSVAEDGTLRLVGFATHPDVRMPRTFNIDPTGTWLYGLGQKGDTIVQFHINPLTGALTPTGQVSRTKVPVSMAFKQ